jgi:hypothetical protein
MAEQLSEGSDGSLDDVAVVPRRRLDHSGLLVVSWSVHPVTRQVSEVRLDDSGCAVFHARPEGVISSSWLISPAVSLADVFGTLCRGSPAFSSRRWTLHRGDASGDELAGFAFYDIDGKWQAPRAFRLVLPTEADYRSASPDMELSRLARAGHVGEGFIMLCSKLPMTATDGSLTLDFGIDAKVLPSVKNFIAEDPDGKRVFAIYKTSELTCNLTIEMPVTPLVAFALAVAIVSTAN